MGLRTDGKWHLCATLLGPEAKTNDRFEGRCFPWCIVSQGESPCVIQARRCDAQGLVAHLHRPVPSAVDEQGQVRLDLVHRAVGPLARRHAVQVKVTVVVGFTSLNLCGDRVTTTTSTPICSARARIPSPYVPLAPMIATLAGFATFVLMTFVFCVVHPKSIGAAGTL